VPARYAFIDELPRTTLLKIDRRALRQPTRLTRRRSLPRIVGTERRRRRWSARTQTVPRIGLKAGSIHPISAVPSPDHGGAQAGSGKAGSRKPGTSRLDWSGTKEFP
jgi:hypothetical protein